MTAFAPPISAMVAVVGVTRDYRRGSSTVRALDAVDLEVDRGELVAIRGRSGSGKTTLLNVIGGLDRPTTGHVLLDGDDVATMSDDAVVKLRRHKLAYIFQAFGLIPILSAAENVEVPLRLVRTDPEVRDDRVAELLDLVGLGQRAAHRPYELSGGEQQRVAVARALANEPELLLADEPTGQLDSATGRGIMRLLRRLVDERSLSIIVATHDPDLLDLADRIFELSDGRLHAPA